MHPYFLPGSGLLLVFQPGQVLVDVGITQVQENHSTTAMLLCKMHIIAQAPLAAVT